MDEALDARSSVVSLDLQNLIEIIPGLALCVLPDGSVEFANRAWCVFTGRSLEQMSRWDWRNAVYPDDVARFSAEWAAARDAQGLCVAEARVRRADGEYRRFVIRKTMAFPHPEHSEPFQRTLIAFEDFHDGKQTESVQQKREESARRYDEERHRLVLEAASDAVISIDDSGTIQAANPASMRIFGYKPVELTGKPLTILMPEFFRELHTKGFNRYLATGHRHINWQGTELTAQRKKWRALPCRGFVWRTEHRRAQAFYRLHPRHQRKKAGGGKPSGK